MLCTVQAGHWRLFFFNRLPYFPVQPNPKHRQWEKRDLKCPPTIPISNPSFGRLVGASNFMEATWSPESEEYATWEEKENEKRTEVRLSHNTLFDKIKQNGAGKKKKILELLEMNTTFSRDCEQGKHRGPSDKCARPCRKQSEKKNPRYLDSRNEGWERFLNEKRKEKKGDSNTG